MAEVEFKVSGSGGYRDGDILSVLPDGWHIPAEETIAWIGKGTLPAIVGEMPSYMKRRYGRRVAEITWKLNHTAIELLAEYNLVSGDKALLLQKVITQGIGSLTPQEAEAFAPIQEMGEHEKELADDTWHVLDEYGLDTNWGYLSLQHHGVMRVDDLTMHDVKEITDADRIPDPLGRIMGKRRWCFRYWNQLPTAKVTALRDKSVHVPVDRNHFIHKAQLSDVPRGTYGMA